MTFTEEQMMTKFMGNPGVAEQIHVGYLIFPRQQNEIDDSSAQILRLVMILYKMCGQCDGSMAPFVVITRNYK